MKDMKDCRVTIIGLGFLMEYIFPCFRKAMGEGVARQINAVTGSSIAGKDKRLGIEVTVGDSLDALLRMKPDLIFFAPPPKVAQQVTEEALIPYFERARQEGWPVPALYVFPPTPVGTYYHTVLGADVNVVHIVPNMIAKVGDEAVPDETYHLITWAADDTITAEGKQRLYDFFAPMGPCLDIPPELTMEVMSAEICVHPITEIADIIARTLTERGYPCTYQQVASVMRYFHQKKRGYTSPYSNNYDPEALSGEQLLYWVERFSNGWYDALYEFLTENGFDPVKSKNLMDRLMDLYIHETQVETREQIETKAKHDATKGGWLELCMLTYYQHIEPFVQSCFQTYPELNITEEQYQKYYRMIKNVAYLLIDRSRKFESGDFA